jgi:bifunctional DNase/RNase
MIQVRVNGIFITQTQASGIILKEEEGQRTLPIVIGEYEAQSIALALENFNPPRPITHDLMANILRALDMTIESVIITELKENTYYAIIRLRRDVEIIEIDARPSDAIALAVRLGASIYVKEQVMDEASYIPEEDEEKQEYRFKSSGDSLENLKQQLKEAVEKEDYEKAARLRDEIKRLENRS